ncbi:MAG: helix-turn-helix domain-containing protein [Lentisphaerota bacterium]
MHRLRLEEAYRLLSDTSMNVSEAASEVGFDDANYFSRLFLKKNGHIQLPGQEIIKANI